VDMPLDAIESVTAKLFEPWELLKRAARLPALAHVSLSLFILSYDGPLPLPVAIP
jgi:hypothetical protein